MIYSSLFGILKKRSSEFPPSSAPQHLRSQSIMSKLSDYSKFDNLNDDDDDDDDEHQQEVSKTVSTSSMQQQQQPTPTAVSPQSLPAGSIHQDETSPERYYFQCNNQRVYDFQQDLETVTIYVKPPPHIQKGSQIKCRIKPKHLQLGLVGADQWYLNEDTFGTVDVDESTWSLEDAEDGTKVVCIYLIKANRGTLWDAALKGNAALANGTAVNSTSAGPTLNEFQKEQVKKELMLQRFQEENPGFDFRGADFNGSVPDAREFMGGVKYD